MKNLKKKIRLILEFVVMIIITIAVGVSAKIGVAAVAEILFKGGK